MAASKFNPDNCQAFAECIFDGLTIEEAARSIKVGQKTVKNWLARGRREDDGPYADFADAVDRVRQEREKREQAMDEDELRLVVSRSAKAGSVAAQKLLWEMIRVSDKDSDKEPKDAFESLDAEDELASAREKREAA